MTTNNDLLSNAEGTAHSDAQAFNWQATLQDLPYEEQELLFCSACHNNKPDALKRILGVAHISGKALTSALYNVAVKDQPEIGEILLSYPAANVNWSNPDNFNLTPLMRAGMNEHGRVVELFLDHGKTDPNIVTIESDMLAGGHQIPRTAMTVVFGHKLKHQIEEPVEEWKQRLLHDSRINWDRHDQMLQDMPSDWQEARSKAKETYVRRREETDKALVQRNTIASALGLPAFQL